MFRTLWLAVAIVAAGAEESPAPPSNPLSFSAAYGDWMVLQQAPAKAAISGILRVNGSVAPVSVQVAPAGYTVQAKLTKVAGGYSWKAFLRPTKAGGDITIIATSGALMATISHATFGDVWYCAGQSNMALPLVHTISRNTSRAAILAGKYADLRIHGMVGNMNPQQNWTTVHAAAAAALTPGDPPDLFSFSATCYYFGESLIDKLGEDAPPIGLIHTAWGGSRIESWLDNTTLGTCSNSSGQPVPTSTKRGLFHEERVVPYLDTTIKGWVWYQGENDMPFYFGNSDRSSGYACLMEKLVASWRRQWSTEPGTTDPLAPFGLVTLAPSGGEGSPDIGAMRLAQVASYGVLPNPVMPRTFVAQAFDLNDPFANMHKLCSSGSSHSFTCCENMPEKFNASECTHDGEQPNNIEICKPLCASEVATKQYMGPIHPRSKKEVGIRLAQGAAVTGYGSTGPVTGPTISGCSVSGTKVTLKFNRTLLAGGIMSVKDYFKGAVDPKSGELAGGASMMQVLVNRSAFCMQVKRDHHKVIGCWDDGSGNQLGPGTFDAGNGKNWVTVDVLPGTAPGTVEVDLAKAANRPIYGIRYAMGLSKGIAHDCCAGNPNASTAPCPLASCPLMASWSVGGNVSLPANPFIAHILGGKCVCVEPQTCDE